MRSLVLEERRKLSLREIDLVEELGPSDVRINVERVGICGSDVHYYTHGRIGPFVVESPMVLGHEAAGTVLEVGAAVQNLKPGDRVCMEPGIPNPLSKASRLGIYNVDPEVRFWATPPVHGCLRPEVVHPAAFTFRLPDVVSFAEGAMVEPFAVGMQAVTKARIKPGDTALVIGCGPIGVMAALAALAGGAGRVIVADLVEEKLRIAGGYPGIIPINIRSASLSAEVDKLTSGWGVHVAFEASGSPNAYSGVFELIAPGGVLVLIGMPPEPVLLDVVRAQSREVRIETVFRYANVFEKAVALISSGKVNLLPLVSATFPFNESVRAFERAAEARPSDIKLQIQM